MQQIQIQLFTTATTSTFTATATAFKCFICFLSKQEIGKKRARESEKRKEKEEVK